MNRASLAALTTALTLAWAAAAGAQPMPTDNPTAAANVKQSEEYSRALRTNTGFRKHREEVECGPITDPQLHSQCIASFESYAEPTGSHRR